MTARWIFALVGSLLVLASVGGALRTHTRLARWHRTLGRVVGYRVRHTRRDGRRRTYHHTQVQYDTHAGPRLHDSAIGTSQPKWDVGAPVAVRYDPAAPHEAVIDTVGEKHFVSMVLGAIGAVFSAVAAFVR